MCLWFSTCYVDHTHLPQVFKSTHALQVRQRVIEMFKSGQLDASTAMQLLAQSADPAPVSSEVAGSSKKSSVPEPDQTPDDDVELDEALDEVTQDDGTKLDS